MTIPRIVSDAISNTIKTFALRKQEIPTKGKFIRQVTRHDWKDWWDLTWVRRLR